MRIAVIGAGHNCLVAAGRLAWAGNHVEVFEKQARIGGACSTTRFPCGCYVNDAANALGLLHQAVLRDLDDHGEPLDVVLVDPAVALPTQGPPLAIYTDVGRTAELISTRTTDTRQAVLDYFAALASIDERTRLLWTDPHATFASFATAMRSLGEKGALLASGSLEDFLRQFFVDETTLALFAASNLILTTRPSAEGTAYGVAYLAQGNVRGVPGWGIVRGGISRVAEAIGHWAKAGGVQIHVESPVDSILLQRGRVSGVITGDGEQRDFDVVISGADPYTTFWSLLSHEPALGSQREEVAARSADGGCAKINLLLEERPDLRELRASLGISSGPALIVACPTFGYLERAAAELEAGVHSAEPYCEVSLDYEQDEGASCGRHFPASIYILFAPYETPPGLGGAEGYRDSLYHAAVAAVRQHIPDFASQVAWREVLLPQDLADRYGMYRGNVDHGPMSPDNAFERRSLSCSPAGSTGIPGLFLCGGGIHPGGLVSGMAGINAAATVMEHAAP